MVWKLKRHSVVGNLSQQRHPGTCVLELGVYLQPTPGLSSTNGNLYPTEQPSTPSLRYVESNFWIKCSIIWSDMGCDETSKALHRLFIYVQNQILWLHPTKNWIHKRVILKRKCILHALSHLELVWYHTSLYPSVVSRCLKPPPSMVLNLPPHPAHNATTLT
jgi:hypothetical protein